jgi:hypothetical protein
LRSAWAAASLMCAGVRKSGSPRISETTEPPVAWKARTSESIELTAVGRSGAQRLETGGAHAFMRALV